MRFNKTAIKGIAATLVLGQLNMALQPLYAAVSQDKGASSPIAREQIRRLQALQQSIDEGKARQAQESMSPADQASQRLARVEELVRDIAYQSEQLQAPVNANAKSQDQVSAIGPNLKASLKPLTVEQKAQRHDRRQQLIADLKGLLGQQVQDQAAVRAEFAQTRQTLLDRKLPAEILARHDEAVAKFEQRVAQFNQSANKAQQGDEQALADLQGFFDQNPTKRKAAPVDPAKLPWRTPEPTKRLPAETQTAWFQNLYANKGTRLAQVGNSLEGLEFVTPPEPGVAPTAADLAETPETQRTAAIKAKALELGNNPVNIQNWVRNNVEWVPTWGAIQSAQDTLDKKRGNAIDIASLEIALLRAAKIPARYQFGTIELPAEQVMNWVGGVSKPEAAQQLLGQGGIANRGLIEGGRISKIRMEHAWVQAYVNWLPSRGAKQGTATQHPSPQAQRNAWVPLDPSFKQYAYSQRLNEIEQPQLNLQAIVDNARIGAEVNESNGSIKALNMGALSEIEAARSSLERKIVAELATAQNAKDLTGKTTIPAYIKSMMDTGLAYPVIESGGQFADLPESSRRHFSYALYPATRYADEPILEFKEAITKLVGKTITLTYLPDDQASADLLKSYLPKNPTDPLPSQLPAYLVKLRPVLKINEQTVATASSAVLMGDSFWAEGGFDIPGNGGWDLSRDDSHVAGQVTSIGINAGGISSQQMQLLKQRLYANKNAIQAGNVTDTLAEEVARDLAAAVIWTWFAAAESHSVAVKGLSGMVENNALSYGLFHVKAQPVFSWGVVRAVKFPGVNVDIGHVRSHVWSKNNDRDQWRHYNAMRGSYLSGLEHSVLDQMYDNPARCRPEGTGNVLLPVCSKGVSAVGAIGMAMEQGQKVFVLTQDRLAANPNLVNESLPSHSFETRQKITSALQAGQQVQVHESPLLMGSSRSAGFIITDTSTGSGAYLIEGGANGGDKETADAISPFFSMIMGVLGGAKNELLSLLGQSIGLIETAFDSIDIFQKCQGIEAAARAAAFAFISVSLGYLFGLAVAGLGFVALVVSVVYLALIMAAIKDAMLRCYVG